MKEETITISKVEYEELIRIAAEKVRQEIISKFAKKSTIIDGHEIKVYEIDGNWQNGTIDGKKFSAKVFEEDSEFGIEKGNISKLWVENTMSYDRGWDKRPQGKDSKELLKSLQKFFKIPTYQFEWKTANEIIKNKSKTMYFEGWGITSLNKAVGNPTNEEYTKAHELWLKLKDAFNEEAKTYEQDAYNSELGSVGEIERREVLRTAWWDFLDGDLYGDYSTLTLIIEFLHHNEKLETGTILFGS